MADTCYVRVNGTWVELNTGAYIRVSGAWVRFCNCEGTPICTPFDVVESTTTPPDAGGWLVTIPSVGLDPVQHVRLVGTVTIHVEFTPSPVPSGGYLQTACRLIGLGGNLAPLIANFFNWTTSSVDVVFTINAVCLFNPAGIRVQTYINTSASPLVTITALLATVDVTASCTTDAATHLSSE